MVLPRKLPKIIIDRKKCPIPFMCKKCLQICPNVVFRVVARAKEERFKELDPRIPGNYTLTIARRDKCTVCNECIEVCPVDAIRIE